MSFFWQCLFLLLLLVCLFIYFYTVVLKNMYVLFIYLLFTFAVVFASFFCQYLYLFFTFEHLKACSLTIFYLYTYLALLFGNILIN